jgi:hypothetical protein
MRAAALFIIMNAYFKKNPSYINSTLDIALDLDNLPTDLPANDMKGVSLRKNDFVTLNFVQRPHWDLGIPKSARLPTQKEIIQAEQIRLSKKLLSLKYL